MKAIRKLNADEIEVRVGQFTKDKSKMSLLLYKNARVDMAILDEVFGPMNWQREHKELKGVIYCGISIRNEQTGDWVTKWDAGTESNTEAQKGEASDSFKRACVNWGIGRELYTSPKIWVDANVSPYDLSVSHISYNEQGEINDLVIKGKNGVIWQMRKNAAPAAPVSQKGNVIRPETQEPAKTQGNAQQTDAALQAIYDGLSEREFTEYNDAIRQMENSASRSAMVDVYKRFIQATFAPLLLSEGNRIIKQKGW